MRTLQTYHHTPRRRLSTNYKRLQRTYQRQATELKAMKSGLGALLQNLHEQTKQAESLRLDIETLTDQQRNRQYVAQLTTATILTEDDWAAFRAVFEQVHPGFISEQKALIPHLTLAETRLLVVEKLGLTTQEIARMLGVNRNTIHQTRARLRRRQAAVSRLASGGSLTLQTDRPPSSVS